MTGAALLLVAGLGATDVAAWRAACEEHRAALLELQPRAAAGEGGAELEAAAARARAALEAAPPGAGPRLHLRKLRRLEREERVGPTDDARPADAVDDTLAQRLDSALAALELACGLAFQPRPAAFAPDPARLQALLARDELAAARRDEGLWRRLLGAFVDWLGGLLSSEAAFDAAQGGRLLFLGGLLGAIGLAARALWRRRTAKRRGPAPATIVQQRRRAAAAALLLRARAAAAGGEHRRAAQEALRAAVAATEEGRLLTTTASRTNRELAAELARRAPPEVARAFGELARRFDRAFYAEERLGAPEASELVDLAGAVVAAAGAAEARP